MRNVFQQELKEVQETLVQIGRLVEKSIRRATDAFNNSDVVLAEEVISDESRIDALASGLDEDAISILVRQQPVASDLRLMVAALRMSASLERMADLAEHVALLARYRFPESVVPESLRPTFARMGELDCEISRRLTELLHTQDLRLISAIRDIDEEIDELHASVFGKVLADSFEGKRVNVIDATLASRYLERFGDHAVSIARRVQYLVEGGELSPRPQQ